MAKDKKITIVIPEAVINSDEWYAHCPWCGKETKCSVNLVLSCPFCGMPALALPCGSQIE